MNRTAAQKLLFLINQGVEGLDKFAFNIIELMGSCQDAQTKQVSYLVATYLLKDCEEKEDMLLLTTNIFVKDFKNLSGECAIPSIAINCLS